MKILLLLLFSILLLADDTYLMGLQAYYDKNASNDDRAIALLAQAAEAKNADAAFLLGVAYSEGKLTPKDARKALYWYEESAKLGDKDAMMLSGWFYYKGEGLPQDLTQAKVWFQRAAKRGDPEAAQMVQLIDEITDEPF